MADVQRPNVQYHEGSPWFWKIFGSAIMGIISILLLAHITNINNNIDRSFLDLRGDFKEMRATIDNLREKIVSLDQGREKVVNLEKSLIVLQASLEEAKHKIAASEAQYNALKEESKSLRDWNKETSKQVQELREKYAAENGKKQVEQPKKE